MKKIIILLLALLMSACSAVKPSEILSSMQTEPTAEATVAETVAPKEATEAAPNETETVIETPKEKTTESPVTEHPEQKPAPEITTDTITETTAEPPTTQKTPIETVKEDKPTELSETVETPLESVTEPPKAEFDVNYWISFARSYALQIGLEIDETAVDCWDNPTTANADCIYLERDLTHRLDRYNRDDDITAVNIWAESLGNGN